MKQFLSKIGLFAILVTSAVALTVWIEVEVTLREVDRVYNLPPGVETLFLGSSQIGCSIVEKPEYHNYVLWCVEKTIYSSLVRLRELEERGQLDKLKNCVVYWNLMTLHQQRPDEINRSWWAEFPITRKHCSDFPSSGWVKLKWAIEHLQWPMNFTVKSSVPDRTISVAERDEKWKQCFYGVTNDISRFRVSYLASGWKTATKHCHQEMARICKAHDIRFVVVGFPMLNTLSCHYDAEHHAEVREIVEFFHEQGIEYVPYVGPDDESVFFDDVHMLPHTATDFTARLYQQLSL